MSQSINTNLISLFGQRQLTTAQSQLSASVERLSSGLRINRAKDDSAGLGISEQLTQQTKAAAVAMRNANDAISMAQTAEGALGDVSDMLGRLKELATQGANDALSTTQRKYITQEMASIRDEINSVAKRTTFNGLSLLTGDFSHAVKGEFENVISSVSPQNQSVLRTSVLQVGAINDTTVDPKISRFSLQDIRVDTAEKGDYRVTNDGENVVLTLTRADGTTKSQSVRVVTSADAAFQGDAVVNGTLGESFTINFDELGVQMSYKNEKVGTGDRSGSEIATKIAAIGLLPDEELIANGWAAVDGADIADVTKFDARFSAGNLKAVITSTEEIRISAASSGLTAATGYSRFTSTFDNASGRYEMAFIGTEANLNAALSSLEVNTTDGVGDIRVDIVPDAISVFTNATTGATSFYEVVTSATNWTSARTNALNKSFMGMDGYLTNVTTIEENYYLTQKLQADAWMGASDNYLLINEATGTTTYASQGASEGKWYWIDGPEAGTQFLTSNNNAAKINTYSNFASGEPNNSSGEHVAQFYSSNSTSATINGQTVSVAAWNDLNGTSNLQYIVEYGGEVGDALMDTAQTLLVGKTSTFTVGDGIALTGASLSGINTVVRQNNTADTGIYKLSADAAAGTVTLKRFDTDGETLMGSETITQAPLKALVSDVTLAFERLGVSVSLENLSREDITLGSRESGLSEEVTLASSKMASLIGENGPVFQTGGQAYSETYTNLYLDTRIGKNEDTTHANLFNQVGAMISDLNSASDPSNTQFNELYNKLGDLLDEVSSRRSDLGAVQNRLQAAINNVNEQKINLDAANSQIRDVDYAAETARMTRMQIGQQAATAMLAQANQIPNVILALLK
jgi:flagellin-like hook-associated protein FlgL